MPVTPNLLRRLIPLVAAGCLIVSGCGSRQGTEPQAASADPGSAIRTKPLSIPLTDEEVTAFLKSLEILPGGQAPPFFSSELPRLEQGNDLESAVLQLRSSIRQAIDPEFQGRCWNDDPAKRAAFQRLRLEPGAFASLVTRISCAWCVQTLSRDIPVRQVRRQIDERAQELVRLLQRPAAEVTAWEQEQLLRCLEDAVALSEFLRLLEEVPPESLQTVTRHREELRCVLEHSARWPLAAPAAPPGSGIVPAGYQVR